MTPKKSKVFYYKNEDGSVFVRVDFTRLNYQFCYTDSIDYRLLGSMTDRIEPRLLRMGLIKTNEKTYQNFLSKNNLTNKYHGN